jgi:hypothetical protein
MEKATWLASDKSDPRSKQDDVALVDKPKESLKTFLFDHITSICPKTGISDSWQRGRLSRHCPKCQAANLPTSRPRETETL